MPGALAQAEVTQLVEPKPSPKENHAEDAHKEHERAPSHLIDGHGGVKKADIHELSSVG